MKMKKLRMWVKVVLVIIVSCLLIITWNKLCEWNERDIQNCIDGGHSEFWCRKNL